MKRHTALLLLLSLFASPGPAMAQQAWLLLHGTEQAGIYRAQNGEMRQVAQVGDIVVYGETASSLAVISQRTPADKVLLQVIDKKSQRVTATWPLQGYPTPQLSGPSRDVALTDRFAYYVALRYGEDGKTLVPNELGGHFDFYRVSLADGKFDRFPLSYECANPRVIVWNDSPLVYSWNGYGVWRFDPGQRALQPLVLRRDIDDTIVASDASNLAATEPTSFADYVALPGVGVFRTSRLGSLNQILDPTLARKAIPGASVHLGAKGGDVIRTFPAAYESKPAIGALTKRDGELRYAVINPASMKVVRELVVPEQAVLDSVTISRTGSVAYVDRRELAVRRITEEGSETLLPLKGQVAPAYADYTRIISLDP